MFDLSGKSALVTGASGGIGAGAGSVSLFLEGEEADVQAAYDLLQQLKADPEPTVEGRR